MPFMQSPFNDELHGSSVYDFKASLYEKRLRSIKWACEVHDETIYCHRAARSQPPHREERSWRNHASQPSSPKCSRWKRELIIGVNVDARGTNRSVTGLTKEPGSSRSNLQ